LSSGYLIHPTKDDAPHEAGHYLILVARGGIEPPLGSFNVYLPLAEEGLASCAIAGADEDKTVINTNDMVFMFSIFEDQKAEQGKLNS